MPQRPLFWKVFPPFIAIVAAAVIVGMIISCLSFRIFYYGQVESSLRENIKLVEDSFLDPLQANDLQDLGKRCAAFASRSQLRMTIISPAGEVLCDSSEHRENMENHGTRQEIREALALGEGISIRFSQTLRKDYLYVARRLEKNGRTLGVVRASITVDGINSVLYSIYIRILLGCLALFLLVAVISWSVSKKLIRPITLLKMHVDRMSSGDFSSMAKFSESDPAEIASLGSSINEIQAQLDLRMKKIIRQKSEKDGIFSSIMEGVIAIDDQGCIISINYAAYNMLELPRRKLKGERLVAIVKNEVLEEFIICSLNDSNSHEIDLELPNDTERKYLSVKAAPLKVGSLDTNGAVLVINDISKLRRLENLRKEFVANVSHELRTPLTTIQGFAETLLNPAISSSDEREEYVKIILKNSNRISAIIDDLLMLSKLEQEGEFSDILLNPSPLAPIVMNAIESCNAKATSHKIKIDFDYDQFVTARVNPSLIEQAVVNLLDNAIKYSDEGSSISIRLKSDQQFAVIEVKDFGFGIPKDLVSRLFERFYRVDKARSRKMGGTGLGLSIVKHIIIAHHGRIEVESEVNKGSLFRIILPGFSDNLDKPKIL